MGTHLFGSPCTKNVTLLIYFKAWESCEQKLKLKSDSLQALLLLVWVIHLSHEFKAYNMSNQNMNFLLDLL